MRGLAADAAAIATLIVVLGIISTALLYFSSSGTRPAHSPERGVRLIQMSAVPLVAMGGLIASDAARGVDGGTYLQWLRWWGPIVGSITLGLCGLLLWMRRRFPEWFVRGAMGRDEALRMVQQQLTRRTIWVIILVLIAVGSLGFLLAGPRPGAG